MHMKQDRSSPALLADKALDWIQEYIDCFEPFQGKSKLEEHRHKALVELAILCLGLRPQARFEEDARIQRFLELIASVYLSPTYRGLTSRWPDLLVAHGFLAVTLRAYGLLRDEADSQAIQWLLEHSNVMFTDRPLYRTLELRLLLDHGGFAHRISSYAQLCRQSMLHEPLNVIYVTDAEAYVLTHTIFYLSDFAARPIPGLYLSRARYAAWAVENLLGMYTRRGNWDLVSELLLSCHCLRRTSSVLYLLGWRALLGAQWPDGAVPGPGYEPHKADALEGRERRNYLFWQCYHTTLVAALAGALCPYPSKLDEDAN
jgi:hypothetical protein